MFSNKTQLTHYLFMTTQNPLHTAVIIRNKPQEIKNPQLELKQQDSPELKKKILTYTKSKVGLLVSNKGFSKNNDDDDNNNNNNNNNNNKALGGVCLPSQLSSSLFYPLLFLSTI
jgi:hypothetical protein